VLAGIARRPVADREAVNALQLLLMTAVSDEISRLRRRIWELEEKVAEVIDEVRGVRLVSALTTDIVAGHPATARLFKGGILREIRLLKKEVLDLVVSRVRSHRPESVPIDFSDPSTGYLNPVVDWWGNWEQHKEPLESSSAASTPGTLCRSV
jgi:hypothetical protein